MFKLKIAESAVKKEIANQIEILIDKKITEIINEVNKKTIIYVIWSICGITLIFTDLNLPRTVFYIVFSIMMLVIGNLLGEFIKSLNTFFIFINNFNSEIKRIVKKEIKQTEKQSVLNQIGLWLSGQSNTDIENFCISYSIRELAKRFSKKKRVIVIRIVVYTIVVILFREIFSDILIYFWNLS